MYRPAWKTRSTCPSGSGAALLQRAAFCPRAGSLPYKRAERWEELKQYDALLMVGGSGPLIDMVNNQRLHDVILAS